MKNKATEPVEIIQLAKKRCFEDAIKPIPDPIAMERADVLLANVLQNNSTIGKNMLSRSPLKAYRARKPVNLSVASNTMKLGLSPKLFLEEGIVKEDNGTIEEFIGSKLARGLFDFLYGVKCLAPENGVVLTQDGSILVYSEYLTGNFRTMYDVMYCDDKYKPTRSIFSPKLWQEFLKYMFLSCVVYRNADLHSRNIGIVKIADEEHIAAIDFGQIFYLKQAMNAQAAVNEFLHILYYWHQLNGLEAKDIALLANCSDDFYSKADTHAQDFFNVFAVISSGCDSVKQELGFNIESTIPNKKLFEYVPNCKTQASPWVYSKERAKEGRCANSLEKYQEYCKGMFTESIKLIPEIRDILQRCEKTGINIGVYLARQGIDVNFFKRQEMERKRQEEASVKL